MITIHAITYKRFSMKIQYKMSTSKNCQSFAAVEESAEDASPVNCHLCCDGKVPVFPNTFFQLGKGAACSPDASVDLFVEGQVVTDCGTQVGEATCYD